MTDRHLEDLFAAARAERAPAKVTSRIEAIAAGTPRASWSARCAAALVGVGLFVAFSEFVCGPRGSAIGGVPAGDSSASIARALTPGVWRPDVFQPAPEARLLAYFADRRTDMNIRKR